MALADILWPGYWERIAPVPGSLTLTLQSASGAFTRSFIPGCSGRPGADATYAFLVKRGTNNKLLINFMGGGACWTDTNCLGPSNTITYIPDLTPFQQATLALASPLIDAGILNHNNAENPFRDWNMIFIPYCSGDIHVGSNDTTYTDPQTGISSVIRHRGFDNFLAVLQYMQLQFPESNVQRVFVTGQSAGGYGAIFNFPYIKELYYSKQVDMLGDGSAGAIDVTDTGASATAFQTASASRWNAGVSTPSWISTVAGQYLTLNIAQFYSRIAAYYQSGAAVPAPGRSRYAQYSSAYDGNQRFFFDVMRLSLKTPARSYTTADSMWGRSDGYDAQRVGGNPALNVNCNWNNQLRSLATGAANSNYHALIASGSVHTISMSNSFYKTSIPTSSGSVRLVDWYNAMLSGSGSWSDALCAHGSCSPPTTEAAPSSALNCSGQPGFITVGDGW